MRENHPLGRRLIAIIAAACTLSSLAIVPAANASQVSWDGLRETSVFAAADKEVSVPQRPLQYTDNDSKTVNIIVIGQEGTIFSYTENNKKVTVAKGETKTIALKQGERIAVAYAPAPGYQYNDLSKGGSWNFPTIDSSKQKVTPVSPVQSADKKTLTFTGQKGYTYSYSNGQGSAQVNVKEGERTSITLKYGERITVTAKPEKTYVFTDGSDEARWTFTGPTLESVTPKQPEQSDDKKRGFCCFRGLVGGLG